MKKLIIMSLILPTAVLLMCTAFNLEYTSTDFILCWGIGLCSVFAGFIADYDIMLRRLEESVEDK